MNISEIKKAITDGKLDKNFILLYGETEKAREKRKIAALQTKDAVTE